MKRKNKIFYICMIVFFGVLIYIILTIYNNYIIGANAYNDISKKAQVSIIKNDTIEPMVYETTIEPKIEENIIEQKNIQRYKYEEIVSLDIDFSSFEGLDVIGWIKIDNNDIVNYPILQSKDNSDYLHLLYDGTSNMAGSIFVDYRNEGFNNRHTIIYGHNMKNGSMFHSIKNYQNLEYANEHRYIYIATPEGTRAFYVYSCHLTNALGENDGFNAYQLTYKGDEWQKWVKETQERSLITSNIEIPEKCNILTLSTCMSRGDKNERCVVHAVEVSNQKLVEIE